MDTEEKVQEENYSYKAEEIIKKNIDTELASLKKQRKEIVDERTYFIDYFYELKDDEKQDLLQNESHDTKMYEATLNTIVKLGRQLQEPYFARFDFEEDDEQKEKYYIGIHTIKDPETDKIIIFDWRAPISSLYYENEPGRASYNAPIGIISGILHLKRRFVFKNGKLIKFTDIKMPSDDEFLYEVLKKNADEHMKTIVQTLQKEQNKIIRDYVEGVSVIQGCAGSGKSSIALHKAAYILYQFRERLKHQQITIISPNNVFAEYISLVLPDLGEENINQILPEDIINECLFFEAGINYLNRMESQEYILTSEPKEELRLRKISRIKCTRDFSDLTLKYEKYLSKTIFIAQELYLDEELVESIDKKELEYMFYEQFADEPLFERTSLMAAEIAILKKINALETKEFIKSGLDDMFISLSVESLYRKMYYDSNFLSQYTDLDMESLKPDTLMWEDICAVALLGCILNNMDFDNSMFYLIADEAQDYAPVFLEILKRRFKGSNMLFVGDKHQLVYENTGNFMNDVRDIIKKRPFRKYDLNTNYRSTCEISDFAGIIRKDDSIVHCVRNGNKPQVVCTDKENMSKAISEYLNKMQEKGYINMAVLCKSVVQTKEVIISSEVSIQVKILPVYLAKGLEFDCVAIWDANSDNYNTESDRQILYTACTRAMHELRVFYSKRITPFLET